MGKFPLYLGIILAGFFVFQLYNGTITPLEVANFAAKTTQVNVSTDNEKQVKESKNKEIKVPVEEKTPEKEIVNDFENNPLTIMAFGDMMMGRYVRILMDKNKDPNYAFKVNLKDDPSSGSKPFFGSADVVFANLEGPIKGAGVHSETSMVFGFNEDTAKLIKDKGINLVSIANNHALDQKKDGRASTIAALDLNDVGWCGNSTSADVESIYYGKTDDWKYAFICLNDVIYKLNYEEAINLIKEINDKVDFLIVSIHWGNEYQHKALAKQKQYGRKFVDAGADLIIGHHPHVVQGFESYKGKLILFSLGNFIFDQYWSKDTQEELGVKISLNKDKDGKIITQAELFPMKSERSQTRLMSQKEAIIWLEKFIGYSDYTKEEKQAIRNKKIEFSE